MGDGALVEFASVVDAVECAAAIQQGVAERQAELLEDQRIALRIGINIGDIIIEDDDIYGDGVNVAARLEQLAEAGGICVSRTVYNHVKNKVAFGFEISGRAQGQEHPGTGHRLSRTHQPGSVLEDDPPQGRARAKLALGRRCGGVGRIDRARTGIDLTARRQSR